MEKKEKADHWKDAIGNNKIAMAIDEFIEEMGKNDNLIHLKNIGLILKSDIKDIKSAEMTGTISYTEKKSILNDIESRFINTIDQYLDDKEHEENQSESTIKGDQFESDLTISPNQFGQTHEANRKYFSFTFVMIAIGAWIWYMTLETTFQVKNLMLMVPLSIPIIDELLKGNKRNRIKPKFTLEPSFESGIYGGLIGGTLAGMFVGLIYYFDSIDISYVESSKLLMMSILVVPFCSIVGIVIGALSQLGMIIFKIMLAWNILISTLFGGIIGSIVGGMLIGSWAGWFFAAESLPVVSEILIFNASVFGAICIILGILFYSYQGKKRYVLRALMISIIISLFLIMGGYFLIDHEITKSAVKGFTSSQEFDRIKSGAFMGALIGLLGGLVISLTIVFYKSWKFSEKQEKLNAILS